MWAHSKNSAGRRHALVDHLRGTAALAAEFAATFGAGQIGYYSGLWHDVGKADPAWQRYLLESEAGNRLAGSGPDHKAAGTRLAVEAGIEPLAYVLQGHHGGLLDRAALKSFLHLKGKLPGCERALVWARRELRDLFPPALPALPAFEPLTVEMFIRLAYSALVDADSLDTEAHKLGNTPALRGSSATMTELWGRFERYHRQQPVTGDPTVNGVRAEVYEACLNAARQSPGWFRLTVPTGGGKTRSGMAFALRHAAKYGLRSVIVAVPYLTITDQTARRYREIFEDEYGDDPPVLLEHHSATEDASAAEDEGFESKDVWRRLSAENWDAPVIVTTTVQLFESLFSNRRSTARKVHRLAKSVIILDEAQALPSHLLSPILDALKRLCADFGTTVVVSTATQPAFESIPAFAGVSAREIVPNNSVHFNKLRRVTYDWRINSPASWPEVAGWLRAERQAMVVLNVKKHAMALLDELDADPIVLHLSTLLCGAHRRDVLVEVRSRLADGKACRLVATQVVEAGVDIDFPAVFRALGPLDSVIQVAGRCNREGTLGPGGGRVVVFRPEDGATPPGPYRTGTDLTASLRNIGDFDPDLPKWAEEYFRRLYQNVEVDARKIQDLRGVFDYPNVAAQFKMIDDDTVPLLVEYGSPQQRHVVEETVDRLRARDPEVRLLLRRLQPYLVSIRRKQAHGFPPGSMTELVPGLSIRRWMGSYDPLRGLVAQNVEMVV